MQPPSATSGFFKEALTCSRQMLLFYVGTNVNNDHEHKQWLCVGEGRERGGVVWCGVVTGTLLTRRSRPKQSFLFPGRNEC